MDLDSLKNTAKNLDPSTPSQDRVRVQSIAQEYEEQLGIYLQNRTLRYLKGVIKEGTNTYVTWLRAALFAEELGVGYDLYVRAQFWFFDSVYRRSPKPRELASFKSQFPAKDRVLLYQVKVEKQKPIVSPVSQVKPASQKVKFKHSETQLKNFMKNLNKTELEVFQYLGASSALFFDKDWLAQNPTYTSLLK